MADRGRSGRGGVFHRYARPRAQRRSLGGVDAARRRVADELFPVLCVGQRRHRDHRRCPRQEAFRGRIILPGLNLMLHALAENTAALRMPPGRYHDFPINTADALTSGRDGSGAVRRACAAASAEGPVPKLFPVALRRHAAPYPRRWRSWIISCSRRACPRPIHRRTMRVSLPCWCSRIWLFLYTRLDSLGAGEGRSLGAAGPARQIVCSPQQVAALDPEGLRAGRCLRRMGFAVR